MNKADDVQYFARKVLGFELSEHQVRLVKQIVEATERGEDMALGGARRAGYHSAMQVVKEIYIQREADRKMREMRSELLNE